jgi:hypothetical protein
MLNFVMLNVIMLNVVMLNVVMLNVIMLNVVMLRVVALDKHTSLLLLSQNRLLTVGGVGVGERDS